MHVCVCVSVCVCECVCLCVCVCVCEGNTELVSGLWGHTRRKCRVEEATMSQFNSLQLRGEREGERESVLLLCVSVCLCEVSTVCVCARVCG